MLCDGINQLLGFRPAEACVGDGLAVDMSAYLLVTGLDIALDHNALDKLCDIRVHLAAVKNFFYDTGLLRVELAGVRVIRIDDTSRIL